MGKGGAMLGKAVKGKSNPKQAKPKESQKKLQADDMRDFEEVERLARLADANRKRLKQLQQQEELNTRINKMKILNVYRQLMRREKVAQLRKDISILAQDQERELSEKDEIVRKLAADLDVAEEAYQTACRTHIEKTRELVDLHQSTMRKLDNEFQRDLKRAREDYDQERQHIVTQHARERKELEGIVNAVNTEERKAVDEAQQAHETEREEIQHKNLEDINVLRINLENKIDHLERQFEAAHQNYVDHTDAANKKFKQLVKKDNKLKKHIVTLEHTIDRFQKKLTWWKKTTVQNERECKARNSALREQKQQIAKHCHDLKLRMKRSRQAESKRLTDLTVMSRNALAENKEKLADAETILKLAELSRKMETEREKIVPFHNTSVAAVATGPQQEPPQPPPQKWMELSNFHKKYNKVLLDKLAIQEEKTRLEEENQQLKHLLKQYLDGTTVPEDALDAANPLVIINGRVNLMPAKGQVRRGPPKGVIEGNTVVNSYSAHRRAR